MHFLFLACYSPAAEFFFLALSAMGRTRGPSVHYDACLDPGRAPWRVIRAFKVAELALCVKELYSASLSRAGEWKTPQISVFLFNSPLRSLISYSLRSRACCTTSPLCTVVFTLSAVCYDAAPCSQKQQQQHTSRTS